MIRAQRVGNSAGALHTEDEMSFDLASHLGATTRVVDRLEHEGRPAWLVVATASYPSDTEDVWDALTNQERIPRWFMPITGELRLGGRYQLQGNAGGEITHCDPPQQLKVTWEFGGNTSWVTVTLAPTGDGGTRLTLEHLAHVPQEFWDQYGPGATGVGWELGLMGLGKHLASGERVSGGGDDWALSPEGRQFVKQVSDGWGQAAIAAGEAPRQARAAAERTRAFYTGDTPAEGS
jgi:uncharacterized protein YndB with AHSA1/START domain